jgi:hypothetical protein
MPDDLVPSKIILMMYAPYEEELDDTIHDRKTLSMAELDQDLSTWEEEWNFQEALYERHKSFRRNLYNDYLHHLGMRSLNDPWDLPLKEQLKDTLLNYIYFSAYEQESLQEVKDATACFLTMTDDLMEYYNLNWLEDRKRIRETLRERADALYTLADTTSDQKAARQSLLELVNLQDRFGELTDEELRCRGLDYILLAENSLTPQHDLYEKGIESFEAALAQEHSYVEGCAQEYLFAVNSYLESLKTFRPDQTSILEERARSVLTTALKRNPRSQRRLRECIDSIGIEEDDED